MTSENGLPTILLGSGTYFNYLQPELSAITIEDVAYGLAAASRFAGQCVSRFSGRRVRYTVAEHCVRGSWAAEKPLRLTFLMHELGEATCGDMVGPLKEIVPGFRFIEKRCEAAGMAHFGVPAADKAALKMLDRRMLATEKRDLCPPHATGHWDRWTLGVEPFDFPIMDPWGFDEAAERFLARYAELIDEAAEAVHA